MNPPTTRLSYARLTTTLCAFGLGLGLITACGSDDPEPADKEEASGNQLLAPPEPGKGVQYSMLTKLEPGEEGEHCQFVQSPKDDIYVVRDEIRFTAGSHHVLLYQTGYTEIPTQKMDGTKVDTSGVFDCSDGATNGWDVKRLIGGSQNGMGESILSFPDGVAKRVPGNTVLLVNAHYINPTASIAKPEVRINLHSIPKSEVKEEGDVLFLYNPFIKVGAGASARARMRCPVNHDITIANVQSHMHRRGVGYAAMLVGGEPFYENDQWENVPVKHFDGGLKVSAGERFDYYCDYESGEDHDVLQGPRSTDEMCMLIGSYYPADPNTSVCNDSNGKFGAEWVGNGKASCKQTFDCVMSNTNHQNGLTTCLMDADPAVSAASSNAVLCATNASNPATECAAELAACLSN